MQTLIIGGGLSGLALAEMLEAKGHGYMLVEARGRFGGRIKTEFHGRGYYDMGPTWFWPGQPRIIALIDRLGLEKFDQFANGHSIFETENGQAQRGHNFAPMQGSWRLKGGLATLTKTLANRIPDAHKCINVRVTVLSKTNTGITATLTNGNNLTADQVILAMPPRIAAEIDYFPLYPAARFNPCKIFPHGWPVMPKQWQFTINRSGARLAFPVTQ